MTDRGGREHPQGGIAYSTRAKASCASSRAAAANMAGKVVPTAALGAGRGRDFVPIVVACIGLAGVETVSALSTARESRN